MIDLNIWAKYFREVGSNKVLWSNTCNQVSEYPDESSLERKSSWLTNISTFTNGKDEIAHC